MKKRSIRNKKYKIWKQNICYTLVILSHEERKAKAKAGKKAGGGGRGRGVGKCRRFFFLYAKTQGRGRCKRSETLSQPSQDMLTVVSRLSLAHSLALPVSVPVPVLNAEWHWCDMPVIFCLYLCLPLLHLLPFCRCRCRFWTNKNNGALLYLKVLRNVAAGGRDNVSSPNTSPDWTITVTTTTTETTNNKWYVN